MRNFNFGIAETSFRDRFRNHTTDFRHKMYVSSAELSKYMWKLKDEETTANIKWNIMSIVQGNPKGGVCNFYLAEKFYLLKNFDDEHLLNKKSMFISKCRHENKLLAKSAEKGCFFLYLYCCIILVFVTKRFVFRFLKTKKKIPEDCRKAWNSD